MAVTLESIKPLYEKTEYTSYTQQFIQHLNEAIKYDCYFKHGCSYKRNDHGQQVKTRKFKITIRGIIYETKIKNWTSGTPEEYREYYVSEMKRQLPRIIELAKNVLLENSLIEYNHIVKVLPEIKQNDALSDDETRKLMFRLNSSYARNLYRKWNVNNNEIINEANRLAKLTVDKYGISVVKFILSLPFTEPHNNDLMLYQTSNKNDVSLNNIQIRIDNDEQVIINFELLTDRRGRKSGFVFSKKNGNDVKLIGTLNQNGELKTNRKYFNPRLLVVINQQENTLYGGLNPRCCIDCGRELTVPESILLGIGPECYQKYGYWSAYSLNIDKISYLS